MCSLTTINSCNIDDWYNCINPSGDLNPIVPTGDMWYVSKSFMKWFDKWCTDVPKTFPWWEDNNTTLKHNDSWQYGDTIDLSKWNVSYIVAII